jgi:hypothetical protein
VIRVAAHLPAFCYARRMRLPALVFILGLCVPSIGCVSLRPVATTVDSPSGVRVVLKEQDDELFKLEVINYSQCVILVDRDRVLLTTANVDRTRVPGGIASLYTIPPGGHHAVNVKFKLDNLHKGERAAIRLDEAVTAPNGQYLPVSPIEFDVD